MTEIRGEYIPVVILLFLAAKQDLSTGRISNRLILTGYGWGMAYIVHIEGLAGIGGFFLKAIWPIAVLYVLFYLRTLGAGDVKLFSSISAFLPTNILLSVILVSFVTGAAIACIRILEHLTKKLIYDVAGKFESKIKFSVCIALGFFLTALGEQLF